MRKLYFLIAALCWQQLSFGQLALPLDFESTTVTYNWTNFDGGTATVIDNPQKSGINTSNKVAKMVKGPGGQTWGGAWIALSAPIDFSTKKLFKVKVFSPRKDAKLLLKVENETNGGIAYELTAVTTKANEWEELSYDYSGINTASQYSKVVLIFDNGTAGDGTANYTFLFDDITLTSSGTVLSLPNLPLDFESGSTTAYSFVNFDGGAAEVIDNPQKSGINTSNKVSRMVKGAGAPWGGAWIGLASPIDFSTNKTFRVKVYSPRVGAKLLFKVENQSDGAKFFQSEVATTVANAWEDLTFDFSAINTANQYQKVVLIFDLGTVGDGSANFTFLFDDIRLTGNTVTLSQMNLPVTFDDPTVEYGLSGFDGAEASSIVADPTNAANKVAKVIKSATAMLWAGTTVTNAAGQGFSSKIPFTATATKMNVRVWSPDAGIKVRLKVEDHTDGGKSVETEATTTTAGAWQTLEFNFANHASGTAALNTAFNYNKASIFFNFGVTGVAAGEKTYYFDDMKFGEVAVTPTLPTLPLDFESSTVTYSYTNFDGGTATVIDNPQKSGINTSNKVTRMVKGAGAPWGGAWIALASPIDFSTNKTFRMKVYSPRANAKVLLKVENQTDGSKSFEKEVATTVANAWEDLTFDYSAINTANQYQKVVVIFDLGTVGDGSANFTFLFDDIRLTSGGGTTLTQMNLPVTFDDPTVEYGLNGFEGAEASSIVADPTNAANKVARAIKSATAMPWAGTTVTNAAGQGFSSKIPFTATATKMNVRVWSPDAGIKVRLKVEDHTDAGKSVETEATTTTAGAWQTLEFNFANHVAGTAALNLANNYNKASIFFNFGVNGATAGEKTYYFDDMKFGEASITPTQPSLPLDFESSTVTYSYTNFDGGTATVIDNPQKSGINTSNKVTRMVKGAGAPWGGAWIALASPIDFSTNKTFRMKVYSPRANAKVLLKVENQTDGSKSFEKEVATTVANAWEDLTFDYSAINTANQYQKVVVIFDLGTVGDGSANFTYLFDDIRLTDNSLPVNLVDFTAAKSDGKVVLNWKTATETNNKGFHVERSKDGASWTSISFVAGKGNTTQTQTYSAVDAAPERGVNYYRLRQVDLDGNTSYSQVRTVSMTQAYNLSVNPNPARGTVKLVGTVDGPAVYTILTVDGRQLATGVLRENVPVQTIDISKLAAGTYLMMVSGSEFRYSNKLVIY